VSQIYTAAYISYMYIQQAYRSSAAGRNSAGIALQATSLHECDQTSHQSDGVRDQCVEDYLFQFWPLGKSNIITDCNFRPIRVLLFITLLYVCIFKCCLCVINGRMDGWIISVVAHSIKKNTSNPNYFYRNKNILHKRRSIECLEMDGKMEKMFP